MKDVRTTIVRLLSNMGSSREIQLYLKRFSQLDASRFAVVKVGGAVLRDDRPALVSSLAFLQQVGLTPIVVHGAGPQLDDEMRAAGLTKQIEGGLRCTPPEVLAVVRRVAQRENLGLVEGLQAVDVRATSVLTGVFEAEVLDGDRFGLVGRVTRVDTGAIHQAIEAGSIPVIASLGETTGGQILNVNADWAANELVKELQPYKIIFLTGTGGLLDAAGRIIDSISLSSQYDELMRQPWIHSGMRVKMEQIHDLLMELPPSSSLSITRPSEMAKELFTHRGSGTLVRRGEKIRVVDSWDQVDLERFASLVSTSFGRALADDYFEGLDLRRLYLSEHYRAAIVVSTSAGAPYMDKFAVIEEAQGEGLGRAIWDTMRAEYGSLSWRSRRENPINEFYFAQSDGAAKAGPWTVFWYGLPTGSTVEEVVAAAANRPATLEEP